jgi:dUTPase
MVVKNNSDVPYNIKAGDRVVQLVLYKISQPTVTEVLDIHDTEKGKQWFWSHRDDCGTTTSDYFETGTKSP